jgi:hypothetical protein
MMTKHSKTPFCYSKFQLARENISPKIIDNLGTVFQKKVLTSEGYVK